MILLQVVSKKRAMAGLSGTGFLTTSPGHILGKRFSSFENIYLVGQGRGSPIEFNKEVFFFKRDKYKFID